jgi:hypothetical protein
MLKLIVAKTEIATAKTTNNVVHVDFASRGRTQIPDANPALDTRNNDENDQLVNSLLKEMKRIFDDEDCDSFLF